MGSAGQDRGPTTDRRTAERFDGDGYVLVVLLVGMAITAVTMTAALPSWRQQVIREREAELVFRGEAIARAVYLYRQKNGQALPASLDILVSQKYLRKRYTDPITGKDFRVMAGATNLPAGRAAGPAGAGAGAAGAQMQGGIIGVRSTSNDTSIRMYNNQTVYSQWPFDFTLEQQRSGGGTGLGAPGGAAAPGGRGRGAGPAGTGELDPITPPGGGFGGRTGGTPAPGGQRGGRGIVPPAPPGGLQPPGR